MITCPNCGQSVREGQRFCGACGTDVQAAVQASAPTTYSEDQGMPYAYNASTPSLGYEAPPESPATGRIVIIAAALILAICCAFACGIVFGFELIPDILGLGGAAGPKPTVTPTPSSMLPILHLLIG